MCLKGNFALCIIYQKLLNLINYSVMTEWQARRKNKDLLYAFTELKLYIVLQNYNCVLLNQLINSGHSVDYVSRHNLWKTDCSVNLLAID